MSVNRFRMLGCVGEVGFRGTFRVIKVQRSSRRTLISGHLAEAPFSTSSRPGKPTDNVFIELLSGKFRAECLNR